MTSIYYLLEKGGVLYRTKSGLERKVAIEKFGYQDLGSRMIRYPPSLIAKMLPFKEEMNKKNGVERITK